MTQEEFYEKLGEISGIQYSKDTEKFFYRAITEQFMSYKKSYVKLEKYVEALKRLI